MSEQSLVYTAGMQRTLRQPVAIVERRLPDQRERGIRSVREYCSAPNGISNRVLCPNRRLTARWRSELARAVGTSIPRQRRAA